MFNNTSEKSQFFNFFSNPDTTNREEDNSYQLLRNLISAASRPCGVSNNDYSSAIGTDTAQSTGPQDKILVSMQTYDQSIIREKAKEVIGGYLNLGEQEGWPDGNDPRLGAAFARYILVKWYQKHAKADPILSIPVRKVINAFQTIGLLRKMLFYSEPQDGYLPKLSRSAYDSTVTGWQGHCITRVVGNLGSEYDPKKPFFEVLINSARQDIADPTCRPSFVSVFRNEQEINERRTQLTALQHAPGAIASTIFYAKMNCSPLEFLNKHSDKLGPKSRRLLHALEYMSSSTINVQKARNCWMKQTMRTLLVSTYVELVCAPTHAANTYQEVWSESKQLYKEMQKSAAIPYVEAFFNTLTLSPSALTAAQQALEHQKQI